MFFPILIICYFIIPKKFIKFKNFILLVLSLFFYAFGEPKYIILMIATVFISYIFGLAIDYFEKKNKKKLKLVTFIISVITILSSLLYFKYTNFFIDNINSIFKINI